MSANIFQNCIIYILPNGLLRKRIKLYEDKVTQYGGQLVSEPSKLFPTHIIVEDSLLTKPTQIIDALKKVHLSFERLSSKVVGTLWLSRCLREKQLLSTENFEFKKNEPIENESKDNNDESPPKKSKIEIHEEKPVSNVGNFEHAQGELNSTSTNTIIINEFQKLADSYRARRDKWRTLGYEKAIQSIKSFRREIVNADDVKNLPNISVKMIDKITEILENGYLNKARELYDDKKTQTLDLFGKIWGAGPLTAEQWYQQGLRTFNDLKEKGNLTQQQKMGLKYYYDILERIPRDEVQEIIKIVAKASLDVEPSSKVIPCGSFRRGKQTCGDIDILIIQKDHVKYAAVLPKIIKYLKSIDFIVDDLVDLENNETPKKYLGLCKLPRENSKNRRLDIFVVPEKESAAAIMHYTGSGLFNRGVRLYASKKNLHLSEHGLYAISYQDNDIIEKRLISTPDEESIFKHLGLTYRPPQDREVFSV